MLTIDDVVFCTAVTPDLYAQAMTLMHSIERVHPNALVVVERTSVERSSELIGVPEDVIRFAVAAFNEAVQGDGRRGWMGFRVPATKPITAEACVANLWRLWLLPRAAKHTGRTAIWLDADCLVRHPLGGLLDLASPSELTIAVRPGLPPWARFLASVYAVHGERAAEFYRRCQEKARDLLGLAWYVDQLALYLVADEMRLTVAGLPTAYNDSKFRGPSPIWHLKHKKRSPAAMETWNAEIGRLGL